MALKVIIYDDYLREGRGSVSTSQCRDGDCGGEHHLAMSLIFFQPRIKQTRSLLRVFVFSCQRRIQLAFYAMISCLVQGGTKWYFIHSSDNLTEVGLLFPHNLSAQASAGSGNVVDHYETSSRPRLKKLLGSSARRPETSLVSIMYTHYLCAHRMTQG